MVISIIDVYTTIGFNNNHFNSARFVVTFFILQFSIQRMVYVDSMLSDVVSFKCLTVSYGFIPAGRFEGIDNSVRVWINDCRVLYYKYESHVFTRVGLHIRNYIRLVGCV